jgi:GGDEF domain-containing protein
MNPLGDERALFTDRATQALAARRRTGHDLALIYIDLDGFKAVNDTLDTPPAMQSCARSAAV